MLCHVDPKIGSLNWTGTLFQKEGYQYPLTYRALLLYFLVGLVLFIVLYGFYRRYRLWHIGKDGILWDQWRKRWKGFFSNVLGHRTILRSFFPGISHFFLFLSLLILGFGVTIVFIQEYFYFPLWRGRFIDSQTYPLLRLFFDLSGAIGWLGTIFLICRRYIQKPKELDNQQTDAFSLILPFFVFLTGFLVTGIRNQIYQSPWSPWSPMATSIASVFIALPVDEHRLRICFSLLWWIHIALSLAFLSYIPFSRLLHLFSSPLSILFRNLEAKGALGALDLEASETFGVGRMEEFIWKDLLELDACTRCGRCQEACPAHITQKHLNPKRVIQNLKRHLVAITMAMIRPERYWAP
ncbi:MAG: respiratory nitrate reductase subunit gamma [Thermodesulfobacteriota bacterium]|nr:respiratory nitrate reductase subunit gamma [Thermodesulfobacteriota bacterium]